jgi:hypothetical protein
MFKAGTQTGFLIVLEQCPNARNLTRKQGNPAGRFRDAADYWADKKVPFRVFYSFE